jgi:hypothetical protein
MLLYNIIYAAMPAATRGHIASGKKSKEGNWQIAGRSGKKWRPKKDVKAMGWLNDSMKKGSIILI